MNFKKYHVSKNLLNEAEPPQQIYVTATATRYGYEVSLPSGIYTVLGGNKIIFAKTKVGATYGTATDISIARNLILNEDGYILIYALTADVFDGINIMLNVGSQPLPYEPYGNTWTDIPYYIHNTSTDTLTTLPAVLYPNDTTVTVGLKGQMEQSSIPSPTSPVMPQGTGNKTANLFSSVWEQGGINAIDGQNIVAGTIVRTKDYIPIKPNTAYSFSRDISNGYMNVRLYRADKSYIGSGSDSTIRLITGSTVPNPMGTNVSFCCFEVIDGEAAYIRLNDASNNTATKWLMVEGEYTRETMPEYEPHGYEIPILSANATTPIYLGEVETTRRVKKLVLTGEESGTWSQNPTITTGNAFYNEQSTIFPNYNPNKIGYCTHFAKTTSPTVREGVYWGANINFITDINDNIDSPAKWKQYLADQYANGTPVCVWYILATPTTGIVNEPLRKIGEYADTVSGITIPTIAGTNTLSVDTTLQPSEVTVNYHGWHPVSAVHERENGAWT